MQDFKRLESIIRTARSIQHRSGGSLEQVLEKMGWLEDYQNYKRLIRVEPTSRVPKRITFGQFMGITIRTDRLNSQGYVMISRKKPLHIAIAEMALGKRLPPNAVVHHLDLNKLNNSPTNLVICQDNKYHMLLHSRTANLRKEKERLRKLQLVSDELL